MKKIEFTKPVYTYEIDAGQHVSNIAYIQWMEVARLKLLEEVGLPVHKVKSEGFVPVLVRTEIDYKKQLFMGDEVSVMLQLTELKNTSAIMQFEFYNQHCQLVAVGKQWGLFMDIKNHRPHKLSEEIRARFERYLS